MSRVLSANRLRDGAIVYLGPHGDWVRPINEAALLTSETACEAAMAKARHALSANVIIDPVMVDVRESDEGRQATSLRNAIRAQGPSVNFKGSVPAA